MRLRDVIIALENLSLWCGDNAECYVSKEDSDGCEDRHDPYIHRSLKNDEGKTDIIIE